MRRCTLVLSMVTMLVIATFPAIGQISFTESSVPDGKAVITLFRVDSWALGARAVPLVVGKNGTIGPVPDLSFQSIVVEPGAITLWITTDRVGTIKLDVKAGETYFAKLDVAIDHATWGTKVEMVPREKALDQLKRCKSVEQ